MDVEHERTEHRMTDEPESFRDSDSDDSDVEPGESSSLALHFLAFAFLLIASSLQSNGFPEVSPLVSEPLHQDSTSAPPLTITDVLAPSPSPPPPSSPIPPSPTILSAPNSSTEPPARPTWRLQRASWSRGGLRGTGARAEDSQCPVLCTWGGGRVGRRVRVWEGRRTLAWASRWELLDSSPPIVLRGGSDGESSRPWVTSRCAIVQLDRLSFPLCIAVTLLLCIFNPTRARTIGRSAAHP